MRSSIEELRIPHEYSSISDYVTISLGIFTLSPADPISLYDSIAAADKALYRAKNDKRNQTVVA
jgi:diguanylate cyclase (GGDEF)-like protein